jgi:hypothetical protein
MYDHMNNSVYYFLYVPPDTKLDLWRKVLTVYTTTTVSTASSTRTS